MSREARTQSARERKAEHIKLYYEQLTIGCGDAACVNTLCASCPNFELRDHTNNQLAVKALELAVDSTHLCSQGLGRLSSPPVVLEEDEPLPSAGERMEVDAAVAVKEEPQERRRPPAGDDSEAENFDEATLRRMSAQADKQPLVRLLSCVFTSSQRVVAAFSRPEASASARFDEKHESEESEKPGAGADDQSAVQSLLDQLRRLDVDQVRNLTSLIPYDSSVMGPLCGSVNFLCRQLGLELRERPLPLHLCALAALFEISVLLDPSYFEDVVPSMCMVAARLPLSYQAALVSFWCQHKTPEDAKALLFVLMQLLTLRCLLMENEDSEHGVNEDSVVCDVCRTLKLLYYTSLLMGDMDPPEVRQRDRLESAKILQQMNAYYTQLHQPDRTRSGSLFKEDPLSVLLDARPGDCRIPAIAVEEFVNDTLNQTVSVDTDYQFYYQAAHRRGETPPRFSLLNHPFLMTTVTKSLALYFDSRIHMIHERRGAMLQALVTQSEHSLYLHLRVHRAAVVQDALLHLELVAFESPGDLKKQLMVEFDGEQGIDEGGLSKEFFQLIVEQIFNPDYGMFSLSQETNCFWFYPGSEESEREFLLVGMLLGLAIYNSVILDIRFPTVLYKKLTGKLGTFRDLQDSHPNLAQGLQKMLDYEHDDLEDTFDRTFVIDYQDAFGCVQTMELKPNGANVPVTKANRKEFVDLYADCLLNRVVEQQFMAFCKGFHLVVDESLLLQLFLPSEIELLVCGSKDYNFRELQDYAHYDSGYSADTPIIQQFWDLVHSMTDVERRQLLEFVTGSDRVPVGGMKKMKFVISRHGPDTDRLPTAHTCFNVLLLPEYSSAEKLRDRLLKAIANSKGFGML